MSHKRKLDLFQALMALNKRSLSSKEKEAEIIKIVEKYESISGDDIDRFIEEHIRPIMPSRHGYSIPSSAADYLRQAVLGGRRRDRPVEPQPEQNVGPQSDYETTAGDGSVTTSSTVWYSSDYNPESTQIYYRPIPAPDEVFPVSEETRRANEEFRASLRQSSTDQGPVDERQDQPETHVLREQGVSLNTNGVIITRTAE